MLRLELAGLSDAAVAVLAVEAGVDPAPVAAAAAGNPFLVTELLAAPGSRVPTSVRHAVLARVSTLPPVCREALERLAVVPTEVPAGLLAALVEDPAALEPAERRGILLSSYGAVRFRHELARRAVEEALPGTRRTVLHRRVLAALAAAGAEPSRLVHHAVAVGDAAAVARYATAAAREAAAANGHREAVAYAELAIGSGELAPSEAAELHGLAARAAYALNRFRDAAGHADRAVALWDAAGQTSLGLGEALLISARMSTLLADPAAARAQAARALAVLEPLGPTRELALAHSTLGAQDTLQARFAQAVSRVDTALELARRTGADDVVAHALNYRGVSLASLGDEAGLADLRESVRLARALGHADYATVAAHNLAVVLLRSARIAEAEPYLELGAAMAREHRLRDRRLPDRGPAVLGAHPARPLGRGRATAAGAARRRRRPGRQRGQPAGVPRPAAGPPRRPGRGRLRRAGAGAGRRGRRGPEGRGGGRGAHRVALAGRRHRPGQGRRWPAARGRGPGQARVPAGGDPALPAPGR